MVYKFNIHNKEVIIKHIEGSLNILKSIKYRTTSTTLKLKEGLINNFVSIKVIHNDRIYYKDSRYYYSENTKELLEVLIIQHELQSNFEVCQALVLLLDKI